MSQKEQILDHLKSGQPLTPIEALNKFGCFRLAARIMELRCSGHNVITTVLDNKVAEYRLL